ncbi:MAG TPA: hypothetical protein VEK33_22650 [Terriglobales bacterium]|nr:hypothetical protein [Terriglobales bacterium]
MGSRIFLTILLTSLFVMASGCGSVAGCPTCGTTQAGAYADIVNIPVPEHNPTGEPGGPFNSFDISWVDSLHHLDYVSDRIGLTVDVVNTVTNIAVNAIQGVNSVTSAGNQASPCDASIPPIVSVFGNFTRYGCRNAPFHLVSGFGANGLFGGFPGAQCCAARSNGVNPMSGPDGEVVTPDGNILFTGNGSAHVVVFDLTTMNLNTSPPTPPTVLATIPTGVAADYDGPLGIAPCVASWNGEAGSAADCGDDRSDELAYDPIHQVLAVLNGDPGLPFYTLVDVSHIVNKTGTPQQQHCLPIDATLPYGPYAAPAQISGETTNFPTYPSQGLSTTWVIPQTGASFNPPSCILGQIYYDGAGGLNSSSTNPGSFGLSPGVPVDNVLGTFPCPDPSNPSTFGGVSGSTAASMIPGVGITPSGASYTIPCHHGPIVNQTTGAYCSNQLQPGSNCAGAIAPAGLGAMAWNPNTGYLLITNSNSIAITNIGSVDVVDPRLGNPNGPVVINSFVTPNCMPTSIVQGPGDNFLVGCADHDGTYFPMNEYVINGTTGQIITEITNVGGVDEIWYNPGDNRYYTASRDMPNGPVLGVIDAGSNTWLVNVPTNTNSHSVSVDSTNNHAFVPMQSGGICGTMSSNGCIGVFAQQ